MIWPLWIVACMHKMMFHEQLLLRVQVSVSLSLHPAVSDPASKSTSCQQLRPWLSWWSKRRRRRTPLLRTPGSQATGGGEGASSGWVLGFKSRPPRSLMPGGGETHHTGETSEGKQITKQNKHYYQDDFKKSSEVRQVLLFISQFNQPELTHQYSICQH